MNAGRRLGDEGRRRTSSSPPACTPRTTQYDPLFISNYLDRFVRDELKRVPGVGRHHHLRRAQVRDAAVARSRPPGRPRHHRRRSRQRAARAERAGCGRPGRRAAGARRGRPTRSASAPSAASPSRREFDDIILKRARRRRRWCALKDVGRTELGAENYTTDLRYNGRDADRRRRHCSCRRRTRCRSTATSAPRSSGCRSASRPA